MDQRHSTILSMFGKTLSPMNVRSIRSPCLQFRKFRSVARDVRSLFTGLPSTGGISAFKLYRMGDGRSKGPRPGSLGGGRGSRRP